MQEYGEMKLGNQKRKSLVQSLQGSLGIGSGPRRQKDEGGSTKNRMRSLLQQSLLNQFTSKRDAEEVVDGKHERHSIESLHSSNCDTCTIRTDEGYDSSSSDESEESGTFLTGGGDPSN